VLIVQDIHVVRGREEVPFEDLYRDELAPAVQRVGAEVLFFGWAPHGAGTGYEALVLTSVPDIAGLLRYQDAVADGELSPLWRKLEGLERDLQSTLLRPGGAVDESPAGGADGPKSLFRHDTITTHGSALESARSLGDSDPGNLVQPTIVLTPALGEAVEREVVVLSRLAPTEALQTTLGSLGDGTVWPGTPDPEGALARRVRISRASSWATIR